MNTNLLMILGCLQQAKAFALEAEKDLYIDDLLREIDECLVLSDNLVLAIDDAMSGVKDDVDAARTGVNHRPKVTYVDFNRKEV